MKEVISFMSDKQSPRQKLTENNNSEHKKPLTDTIKQTIFFLAGIILTAIAETFFGNPLRILISPDSETESPVAFALFIGILTIVVVIAVAAMFNFLNHASNEISSVENRIDKGIELVKQQINSSVVSIEKKYEDIYRVVTQDVETGYTKNQVSGDDQGYVYTRERIVEAKEKILVIGDFSPEWCPLVVPSNRRSYLENIEKTITTRIRDLDFKENFEYTRIIQRDKEIVEQIRNNPILKLSQMKGDEQVFFHCHKVWEARHNLDGGEYKRVKINFYIIEPIPNSPSILLIDDKHMLFTIPKRTEPHAKQKVGEFQHSTDGVLFFSIQDKGKQFARDFEDVIRDNISRSVQIKDVENTTIEPK
jgi:hypothetical protein